MSECKSDYSSIKNETKEGEIIRNEKISTLSTDLSTEKWPVGLLYDAYPHDKQIFLRIIC